MDDGQKCTLKVTVDIFGKIFKSIFQKDKKKVTVWRQIIQLPVASFNSIKSQDKCDNVKVSTLKTATGFIIVMCFRVK